MGDGSQMKIRIEDVEEELFESPGKKFGARGRHISVALQKQDKKDRTPPFDLEHVILAPGKRLCPYHTHATSWEMYYAISGKAQMRIDGEVQGFEPGDVIQCAPGQAHQLINNGTEDFEYLVIANNPEFDACYYPDSDKMNLNPIWKANPKDANTRAWTLVQEGLVHSYWHGEEYPEGE